MKTSMPPELIGKVVERLKAMADESRIRLLLRLREAPCNVTTLSHELSMGQASVSKHLAMLRQVGLVQVDRQGTQAIYRIHDPSIFNLCEIVCDGVLRHLKQEHAALGLAAPATRTTTRSPKRNITSRSRS